MNISVKTILLTLLVVLFSPPGAEASADSDGSFVKLIDIPCNKVALAYTPHIVDGMTIEEIKDEIANAVTLTMIPLNSCHFDSEAVRDSFVKNKELQLARERSKLELLAFKEDNSTSIHGLNTDDQPDPPDARDWVLIDTELIENSYLQFCLKVTLTVYTWANFDFATSTWSLEYTIVSSIVRIVGCMLP